MAKLGFGKYKDLELRDVPEDYLRWLITDNEKRTKLWHDELEAREARETMGLSWLSRIVKTGYRTLMKQHHPDVGGTNKDAIELKAAYDRLEQWLEQNDADTILRRVK